MTVLDQLGGRRVLFLNWRDLSNPAAGGAEAYAEQIARRFAAAGCHVTLFTSAYGRSSPYDWADQYLVVRQGGRFGVYAAAARHLRRYRRHYDAVVDFQNGIPFFAPLWAPGTPVICVIHHVHQAQFGMYFPWPVSVVGRLLEGPVSRRVYRDGPLVAVSPSTRAEIRRQLGLRGPVHIVPNGIDPPLPGRTPRAAAPAIAIVTRLVPHKQLHLLVQAIPALLSRWPDLRVDIAGEGPVRAALQDDVRRLGLDGIVRLPGRVSEQAKSDLLSRAWLTVVPSLAEGWGLTVLEANAAGTPALAFDVPGLRDSVRNGLTGWLVAPDQGLVTPLTRALEELADSRRQKAFADQCRRWASRFTWDSSAERLAAVLLSESARRDQPGLSRRDPVDLATVASWPAGQVDEDVRRLRKTLRVTDQITDNQNGLSVLLSGCDEVGALAALQRIPIVPARLRLATTAEVLSGAGADGPA